MGTKSSDSIECETKKSNALKMMKSFVLDSESRSDKCSESQIIDEVLLIDEEKENERNLLLQQMSSNDANDHSSEDEIFQHPENEKYVKKNPHFAQKNVTKRKSDSFSFRSANHKSKIHTVYHRKYEPKKMRKMNLKNMTIIKAANNAHITPFGDDDDKNNESTPKSWFQFEDNCDLDFISSNESSKKYQSQRKKNQKLIL